MKKNNVLILSAGRRVELVQDFQTEAAKFSDDVKILTTDLVPRMSSACHVSDGSFEVPLISSDSYIDSIFDLAVRENIGLIIPTIDTELQNWQTNAAASKRQVSTSSFPMRTLLRDAAINVKPPTCLPATAYARPKFTTARSWFSLASPNLTTAAAPSAPNGLTHQPI